MKYKSLLIMIGISGSGKSTYVINNFPDACICSADHYLIDKDGNYNFNVRGLFKAHKLCQEKVEHACLQQKPIVVVDNTNVRMKEIKPYIQLAEKYKYEINFIKIDCPVIIAIERNQHNVPKNAITKQYNRLQNLKLPEKYKITTIKNNKETNK